MSYRQSSSNREADVCVMDRAAQKEKQVAMFFIQQLKQRSTVDECVIFTAILHQR
jgi:hypothetical protein